MTHALILQTTYEELQIGIALDGKIIDRISCDKKIASKSIITYIDTLLKQNNITLQSLSYLAVNLGPAPFTSLRVVISTANGISFASSLPIVGCDGLRTMLEFCNQSDTLYTVALLNAFNQDVYFGTKKDKTILECSYQNIDTFLETLKTLIGSDKVCFIGQGAELFKAAITEKLGPSALISKSTLYPELANIAKKGFEQWQNSETQKQVLPLYLKKMNYKISIPS